MCTLKQRCPICTSQLGEEDETSCSTEGIGDRVRRRVEWRCRNCGAEVKLAAKVRGVLCAR